MGKLEPNNGAAWLPAFNEAWAAHHIVEAESILARMAKTTRYNDSTVEALKAWKEVYGRGQWPIPASSLPHYTIAVSPSAYAFGDTSTVPNSRI